MAERVPDEVGEHLPQPGRVAYDRHRALGVDGYRGRRERRREGGEIDGLEPEREQLGIRDDPLEVTRRGDAEGDHPPQDRRVVCCGSRGRERLEGRNRAAQLVRDDAETLTVRLAHARSARRSAARRATVPRT